MSRIVALFGLLLAAGFSQAQTPASFEITAPDFPPDMVEAMEYAADIWSSHLSSEEVIKINVVAVPIDLGFLGLTWPNGRKNFAAAPQSDLWYVTALANALSSEDLAPAEADMEILLNMTANWYSGTDGAPGATQTDLVSVFLHEIGHGLGITSLARVADQLGSFGTITSADFMGFSPNSFDFPDLEGLPSVFDRLLVDEFDQLLTDLAIYPNNSVALEGIFTSNQVFCNSTLGILANDGSKIKVYAPAIYAFGSSITHLDPNSFPLSNENSLMTPFIPAGAVEHEPGPVTLGILQDLGWTLSPTALAQLPQEAEAAPLHPNPVLNQAQLELDVRKAGIYRYQLFDFAGRLSGQSDLGFLATGPYRHTFELQSLPEGIYFLQIEGPQIRHTIRFIRMNP